MLLAETEGMNNSHENLLSYSNTNIYHVIKLFIADRVGQSDLNPH
jgi:hypothetical protein